MRSSGTAIPGDPVVNAGWATGPSHQERRNSTKFEQLGAAMGEACYCAPKLDAKRADRLFDRLCAVPEGTLPAAWAHEIASKLGLDDERIWGGNAPSFVAEARVFVNRGRAAVRRRRHELERLKASLAQLEGLLGRVEG